MLKSFFEFEFMQMALISGIFISILSGVLGAFIVQRKMSFLGSGLSHSALGGVGLGILLGVEPIFVILPFVLLMATAIFFIQEKTNLAIDTSIGIISSASVALGVVFISLKSGYSYDAYSYLFGSILAISKYDTILISILTIAILIIIGKFWKNLAYSTFDKELAISDGVKVVRDNYLLILLIAIFIAIAIKLIGIILTSAFLVLPAAIAKIFSKTFFQLTVFGVLISIITTVLGLFISFYINFPSGATIILLQTMFFCCFLLSQKLILLKYQKNK